MRNPLLRLAFLAGVVAFSAQAQSFDIAPFAHRCSGADTYTLTTTFDYLYTRTAPSAFEKLGDRFIYALQWAEERDVERVSLRFAAAVDHTLAIEYWFQNWPDPPPTMPTIEDPVDDPWQGRWLPARTTLDTSGTECRLAFLPLSAEENPRAANLPGVRYRRTLKVRLICKDPLPPVEAVRVFTRSKEKLVPVRVECGVNGVQRGAWEGRMEAYNGVVQNLRGWHTNAQSTVSGLDFRIQPGEGILFDVLGTDPAPQGSHDVTIVTVRAGDRTFSFALPDVEKEPLYLPDFDAYVTLGSDPRPFAPSLIKPGERIREKLASAPEQTYERASREIPSLDPVERQGGMLYLPLAIDSSWQKFAFEWGGNVFVHKTAVKAKGAERQRLEWPGERLDWRFGTGATPSFRPATQDSQLHVLDDYLPVAVTTWSSGEVEYRQEAFATPLDGSLAWERRDEQSPVVLMVRIVARNKSATPQVSHLWLGIRPGEPLRLENNVLFAAGGELVRARVSPSALAKMELASVDEQGRSMPGVHLRVSLSPEAQDSTVFALPFIPRLTSDQRERLTALDYDQERAKVIGYWKPMAESGIRFEVPESRFVNFSRAMLLHMHLSTARDPKSGLLMVPAASYGYQVFANESCFQILALDALGDHQTASQYLETFIQLQGSRPFLGTFTGDQRAVYHGARVSPEYDYTASEYNLDHGTVLWTLAEHYFITRDRTWLSHAVKGMIQAADWVATQRRQTMLTDTGQNVPEYGLLPAGHLEDNADWGHWFAVNAYASAGMSRLAEALQEIHHPEASRVRGEAEAYRDDLRQAIIRATQSAPVTRLRDHTWIPCLPVRPHQRQRLFGPLRVDYYRRYPNPVLPTYRLSATREVLYGPLILLNLGIFGGDEPIASWILDDWEDNLTMSSSLGLNVHGWVDDESWFSRGGMVFQANLQNPVLAYLRRQEIPAAIRNLYNDFVSCYYPDVNVFTEEYRQWRSPSGPFYKVPDEARFVNRLRDLLVREEGSDLWLASGTPRRWLAPGEVIRMRQMPTTFGPVDLELKAGQNDIVGQIRLPSRNRFNEARLVLRVPESRTLASVRIDGQPWSEFDRQSGVIRLPQKTGANLQLEIALAP